MYYVLMMHCDPGCALTTDPQGVSLKRAQQSVSWQTGYAFSPDPTYPICTYDPVTGLFHEIDGEQRALTITRGPYTEEAHADFLARLPRAVAA